MRVFRNPQSIQTVGRHSPSVEQEKCLNKQAKLKKFSKNQKNKGVCSRRGSNPRPSRYLTDRDIRINVVERL